jgi:hypothetical protein
VWLRCAWVAGTASRSRLSFVKGSEGFREVLKGSEGSEPI